jgi:hypothetical protein
VIAYDTNGPQLPPVDAETILCPYCQQGDCAEFKDDTFACDAPGCRVRFLMTGTGPELLAGEFVVGETYLAEIFNGKEIISIELEVKSKGPWRIEARLNGLFVHCFGYRIEGLHCCEIMKIGVDVFGYEAEIYPYTVITRACEG